MVRSAVMVPVGEKREALYLLCSKCKSPLRELRTEITDDVSISCENCGAELQCIGGIWRCLPSSREKYFHAFISDYEQIRAHEGRGSADSSYYLALPYKDLSEKNPYQWKIRAQSFKYIERKIIGPLEAQLKRPLRILDLGAGNGWMSYRLASRGHYSVAVDILTNTQDGLGAAAHFRKNDRQFPCVQAELDHLPFASSTFDIAIFNASFHYSENFVCTFGEAFRCVQSGGAVVIADTPWYAREESGHEMVSEKRAYFKQKHGFASDSINSLEFLTPDRLQNLQSRFDAQWYIFRPFYGVRWSLRPLIAKLKGRRKPSRFFLYAAWVSK